MIRTVVFDFGGVVAEEGFYKGLLSIGRKNGLDPLQFFKTIETIIHETGYLTGRADEALFWNTVRLRTGINSSDAELRHEIISRFTLRPAMIRAVDALRHHAIAVAMLSDQTNWLDEINRDTGLLKHFDRVFNSYHIHQSKRDAAVFGYLCSELRVHPSETLFVDDNAGHVSRAQASGLQVHLFTTVAVFQQEMKQQFSWYRER